MKEKRREQEKKYEERFRQYLDELKWLFMELYPGQEASFWDMCDGLRRYYEDRTEDLKQLDEMRAADPNWFRTNDMLGMMLYVDAFAGDLKGMREKLPYLQDCGVNCLHLMSLLDCPAKDTDDGHEVVDFRKVRSNLGTMEDLRDLAKICHANGINLCLNLEMASTSDQHEWAIQAKSGEVQYEYRYFIFDDYSTPELFDQSMQAIFPEVPGNFTWNTELGRVVMTRFHANQWDLNYGNPVVLKEMAYNILYLANQGIDILRLDSLPYIWKQLGTSCIDQPQVHNIIRIIRIITDIVCPGVLLLGETNMDPEKAASYFGTPEKPECHMVVNEGMMDWLWHTVATKDVRLLRRQLDILNNLPREDIFQTFLRSPDAIEWKLDYPWLQTIHTEEIPHKQFLNDFFTGAYPDSFARGELRGDRDHPENSDLCGTTASFCGMEKASYEGDDWAMQLAIRYDLTLHACMLAQSGIPVLYSGDEIGQENDYMYHEDERKEGDVRWLHRGNFRWDLEKKRVIKGSRQQQIFDGLRRLERIRSSHAVFGPDADVSTVDTWDDAILGVIRSTEMEKMILLSNFSEYDRPAWIDEEDGTYIDLISGQRMEAKGVQVPAYGCRWLLREEKGSVPAGTWSEDEKETA